MGDEDLHPMFKDMLNRSDGWPGGSVNESSLDYNFMTRHYTMSVIFLCITGLAVVAGNIGNVLVIGAVLSYKRLLRNTGNIFIVNLAVADLCITSIVGPFNMIGVVKGPRFFLDKVILCNILGSVCTVSCMVSMMSIAAVAVNRLVCICRYNLYFTVYTRRKTLLYSLGLWLYSMCMDLPNWLGWGGHTFGLKEMGCTFDRVANHSYTIFLATMSIAIPMIVVCVCYLLIFSYVRRSRAMLRKITGRKHSMYKGNLLAGGRTSGTAPGGGAMGATPANKEDVQLAVTLFVTFIVFLLCWSPYMLAIIIDKDDRWPKEVYVVGTLLGHSNSFLNSIIYALSNHRFRQGYYVFLHKLFCLKIKKNGYVQESKNGFKYTSKLSPSSRVSKSIVNS